MEMIRRPLQMTEVENRKALEASERRLRVEGHPEGNRQERRRAARFARRQKKRETAVAQ